MSSTPGAIVRRGGISKTVFVVSLVVVAVAAGVGGYFTNALLHPGTPTIELYGDGSTLVYPLLSTWTSNYNKLHSDVQINYQPVGSGTGITDFGNKIVDFAGTDAAPDTPTLSSWNTTLTIPETIGAVTIAYNVPNVPTGMHVDETIAAEIFNGTISNWDDPAIAALNNGISFPNHAIQTVHRSDSSGTTFIFTSYLNRSGIWSDLSGNYKVTKSWPSGPSADAVAESGNQGVATTIGTPGCTTCTPYSIGYVEVAYALQNNMDVAYVQNKDRTSFIQPTLANITAAVASVNTGTLPTALQSWSAVSLILEPGANSYPIVSFTYLLVYQQLNVRPLMTQAKAESLVDFLWYIVHDGQSAAGGLDYAALPQSIVAIDETAIKSFTFNGQSLPT